VCFIGTRTSIESSLGDFDDASTAPAECVCIFSAGEIDGKPVISMELIGGGTLKELVEKEGPLLSPEQLIRFYKSVLGSKLRPTRASCIATSNRRTVSLIQMAQLARSGTTLTATGSFIGTPAFASPKQLRAGRSTCAPRSTQ
jgi:hypothetical protein